MTAPGRPAAFLCDHMLIRLGRWLRAAGDDTAIAPGTMPDTAVLAWALRDSRLLLTRARGVARRRRRAFGRRRGAHHRRGHGAPAPRADGAGV
ncbi:MAG: hypothetical protein IRY94_16695, partial [Rhodospirillaceae bacterium]|nr:hypothetical protein [Rhodospirillaceae bacterium]